MTTPTCVFAFSNSRKSQEVVRTIVESSAMFSRNASLWIWMRGQYDGSSLSDAAWKTLIELSKARSGGWLIRNEISLSCKVVDPVRENRLKRAHENIYHLTKGMNYYYDRSMGSGIKESVKRNRLGQVKTHSGVIGDRYASLIGQSTLLNDMEKEAANNALVGVLKEIALGTVSDFRMYIRGIHSAPSSTAEKIAKDGFFIRTCGARSMVIEDLWTAYGMETNMKLPDNCVASLVRLSCPPDGAVLDLFPSPEVAKIVMDLGRSYVANGVNVCSKQENNEELFKTWSKNAENQEIQGEDRKESCRIEKTT